MFLQFNVNLPKIFQSKAAFFSNHSCVPKLRCVLLIFLVRNGNFTYVFFPLKHEKSRTYAQNFQNFSVKRWEFVQITEKFLSIRQVFRQLSASIFYFFTIYF